MNMKQSRRTIERHIERGDIAKVAKNMGVKWQSAYQYIRGSRQNSPAAQKYLIEMAAVIAERKKSAHEADKETANKIEQILQL